MHQFGNCIGSILAKYSITREEFFYHENISELSKPSLTLQWLKHGPLIPECRGRWHDKSPTQCDCYVCVMSARKKEHIKSSICVFKVPRLTCKYFRKLPVQTVCVQVIVKTTYTQFSVVNFNISVLDSCDLVLPLTWLCLPNVSLASVCSHK